MNDIDAATAKRRFTPRTLFEGEVLFEEGSKSTAMAWVQEGRLEVRKKDIVLATLGQSQLVGEMGLFEDAIRSASVIAKETSIVWVIERTGYEELRDTLHPVGQRIEAATIRNQVGHLRATGRKVARLGLGEPCQTRPPEGFFAAVARLFGRGTLTNTVCDVEQGLAKSVLFKDAPTKTLAGLARWFVPQTANPGTFLCTEGVMGKQMYVLVEGAVDVIVAPALEPQKLVTLHPGSAFGMVALASKSRRMASCVVAEQATVLTLEHEGWNALFEEPYMVGSTFRRAVIRAFCSQLAYSSRQLTAYQEGRRSDPEILLEASRGIHTYDLNTTTDPSQPEVLANDPS